MKLVYQWLIVLTLAGLLWAVHTYGGAGCSKPLPTSGQNKPYIPPLKIIVQRRASLQVETSDCPQTCEVPKIPITPPSKTVSQKRRERRKAAKLKTHITRDEDEIEWDFCTEKMIQ